MTTVTPRTSLTLTNTVTLTEAKVHTTSVTTTERASTTVVSTEAGYTPLATQIAAKGYIYGSYNPPSGRRRSLLGEDFPMSESELLEREPGTGSLLARSEKRRKAKVRYPHSVRCNVTIEQVTYTTITVPPHKTKTLTAALKTVETNVVHTTTWTRTVAPPDVSVTFTNTAPVSTVKVKKDIHVTTTTLQTQTITVTMPGPPLETVIGPCQPNNFISTIDDRTINDIVSANSYSQIDTVPTSVQDCCQACQQTSACAAFYFDTTHSKCGYLSSLGSHVRYALYEESEDEVDTYPPLVMGNSVLGQFESYTDLMQ